MPQGPRGLPGVVHEAKGGIPWEPPLSGTSLEPDRGLGGRASPPLPQQVAGLRCLPYLGRHVKREKRNISIPLPEAGDRRSGGAPRQGPRRGRWRMGEGLLACLRRARRREAHTFGYVRLHADILATGPDFGPWSIDPSELPIVKERPPSSGAEIRAEKFLYVSMFTQVLHRVTGSVRGMFGMRPRGRGMRARLWRRRTRSIPLRPKAAQFSGCSRDAAPDFSGQMEILGDASRNISIGSWRGVAPRNGLFWPPGCV